MSFQPITPVIAAPDTAKKPRNFTPETDRYKKSKQTFIREENMKTEQNIHCPICQMPICFLSMDDYSYARCTGSDHHEFEIIDFYQFEDGGEIKLRATAEYLNCPEGNVFQIPLQPENQPQPQPAPCPS